jgi:MOSC domain-containing protein YiiM
MALGKVLSLHLHPEKSGGPFSQVSSFEVVAEKGILGNPRYFGRVSRNGQPGKRQITLIEREQIKAHAGALGLASIPPGIVRSNVETSGIDLASLVGRTVQIGNAILYIYELRLPCEKMDAICTGLRNLMENGRQGVLAQIIRGGTISVGDIISVHAEAADVSIAG